MFQGGSGPTNGQTLAILANDSLWTWGDGTQGQLGNGGVADEASPIRITLPGSAKPAEVASGGYASYVIDTRGRLWDWGRNEAGQLGTGRLGPIRRRPKSVGISLKQVSSTAQNVAALSN
ncbi:MAG: hypothetical protein ACRDVW_10630 [Acidimicrobiales bacterium]